MRKLLLLKEWWDPKSCQPCRGSNGGECECDKSGNCKCLEHEAARQAGVRGNPWLLTACPLWDFSILVRNAVVLGTGVSSGVPTLQALSWMDIETPCDTLTTQILVNMILEDSTPRGK